MAPCLRAEVVVRPFDAVEGDCRYVVAVEDRHFLVTAAVAAVLEESRQPGTLAALAKRASARLGLAVSPEQVRRLLREQAPPVLFHPEEKCGERNSPIRFRRLIASAAKLRPILNVAAHLFSVRTSILLAVMFVVVEWLVASCALTTPHAAVAATDVAATVALTMLGVVVHELGHLAACTRYAAPHGGIGVGIYWCFPAFYAEVHGAWMLARHQRAAVDAGGLYFQCGYVLVLGLMYLASGAPFVLAAIAWSHVLMLHTLNPVLKYDGYWLLTDLTGAHNLHRKVRTIGQRVWRALRLRQLQCLPERSELMLLGAFAAAAIAYFVYVLLMLGRTVAAVASQAVESWSAASGPSLPTLQAVGESLLLALLLAMTVGVALVLARSLGAIAHESQNDQ
jgi:putative peptide zinc metalloprotease protein